MTSQPSQAKGGEASAPQAPQGQPVVLLVTHSAPGGVQEIWSDIAEGLRQRGYPVQLLALYPDSRTPSASAGSAWTYVTQQRPRSVPGALALVGELIRFLRTTRPRVVLSAMPAANAIAPIAATLARTGTPVVISHHSPVHTHSAILGFVDRLAGSLPATRAVLSVSRAVHDSLNRKPARYQAKRHTIHNALPPRVEAWLGELAEELQTEPCMRRRVVAIGRLAPQKNYAVLIRAAARLPDLEVSIIGSGPDERELKDLANSMQCSERVQFLGHQSRHKALRLLATGAVFAQMSLFEGHSLALIEAAKLGLPLVVSDATSQIEAITSADGTACGIVIEFNDDATLAKTIASLLDDRSFRAEWAERSARLGSEFTYERMVSAYERMLG